MTLSEIIMAFKAEFPGWWYSVGECHVSCDATVGPTTEAPDAHLLNIREFDEGIDGDIRQPSTIEEALLNAIGIARQKRAAVQWEEPSQLLAIAPDGEVLCATQSHSPGKAT